MRLFEFTVIKETVDRNIARKIYASLIQQNLDTLDRQQGFYDELSSHYPGIGLDEVKAAWADAINNRPENKTGLDEEELDEAAPENARSLAIYNSLLDLKDSDPKEFKKQFIQTLISEFPNLTPKRANAWLGFAHKAHKAHQDRAASHDDSTGPLQALRTKDILNRPAGAQRRAQSPGMVPGPDNDLVSSDYDTKRMLNDIDRIVKLGNAEGSSEWYSAADGQGASEVTWDLETLGRGDQDVQGDQAKEVQDNKRILDGLAKRYQGRVISYDPVKQVGKFISGRLKLALDNAG